MATLNDEDNDAVLSDFDADDPLPPIEFNSTSTPDLSLDRFRQVLEELGRQRKARISAENSKSELQLSFNRLKLLAHHAIKKRDDISRQRNEALFQKDELLRSNDKLSAALSESSSVTDDVMKQRDTFVRQFEEALRAKGSLRSEMETAAQMLVNGIEKISEKVSNFKDFIAGGFPRSQKYTGMLAVAYGVIQRTNDIVEELLSHNELTAKSRNDACQQIHQRNHETPIEITQLESTISGLRKEISKTTLGVGFLEKSISEKNRKISEMLEKENSAENEVLRLKRLVSDYDDKLKDIESMMHLQRPLLVDQLSYIAKLHDEISNVVKIIDATKVDEWELPESSIFPQEKDMEGNLLASLAGMKFIYELSRHVAAKTRDLVDERNREVKSLNETVSQLVKEKERTRCLLRSALSIKIPSNLSSKSNELFKIEENGLKETGVDFRFSNHLGSGKVPVSVAAEEDVYALTGALENNIKQSQLEILELQHTIDELRQQLEAQAVELVHTKHSKEEFEEEERVANDNVEGLMMDIATTEEEITRWKVAAQQEAAAGKALEQEFVAQLSGIQQELKEAKQEMVESEKKLKYKEETADAAMSARDAAEKSLRFADLRATRLKEKVEELAHQLEELDKGEMSSRAGEKWPRYVCWPWQWIGLTLVGSRQSEMPHEDFHEMELSEPLL